MRMVAVIALFVAAACGKDRGDELRAELRALAGSEAPCATAADCCVVIDGCFAQAFVVARGDYERAQELVDGLDDSTCKACMSPAVELECVEGACLGRELDPAEASHEHLGPHCGAFDPPPSGHPHTDPGHTGRILGCGT